MARWLSIIGLGEDGIPGLSPAARAIVAAAEVVVGGRRHLTHFTASFPDLQKSPDLLTWKTPLHETVADILDLKPKRVVVLATGNPQYFGIGVTLGRAVAADELTILPSPSAFSLAAARMGWPQADIQCLTLHGRPLALLRAVLYPGARLLLLSENRETPEAVAGLLHKCGFGGSRMTILNHMGGEKESRHQGTADEWRQGERQDRVLDLNVIAVDCVAGDDAVWFPPGLPGLPDRAFQHDGQLTKSDVRAATLAALAPLPGHHLWDLGAGAGSVAIEWMRCHRRNRATAVERHADRVTTVAINAEALGVPNMTIFHGAWETMLPKLERPDAIFIGGGLGEDLEKALGLIDTCCDALPVNGRLVVNSVTLGAEAALLQAYNRRGGRLRKLAISDVDRIGPHPAWRPARPVTQWRWVKAA